MTQPVAAFDVDGTLTTRDCVVPFLRRVAPRLAPLGPLTRRSAHLVASLARRDRDRLKQLAAESVFTGRDVAVVEAVAKAYAAHVHGQWLRPDTVARLDAHRRAGSHVVLVSASFEVYLHPLGDLLGVDGVLGTRLGVRDGRFTGHLDGPNCRGPEKVTRLHAWLDATMGGRAASHVTAYGDSNGDRELLCDADVAVWSGRHRAPTWLPQAAERSWSAP